MERRSFSITVRITIMAIARLWKSLSGPAKLVAELVILLGIEIGLFITPSTWALGGLVDPFHPWELWFFVGVFTLLLLFIAILAWAIHTLNGRGSTQMLSINATDKSGDSND